jgi:hypothetical protein
MSQADGSSRAAVRVLVAGSCSLPEAIENALGEHLNSSMPYVVPALHAQLESRWRYAAKTYRAANPDVLPASKAHRNRMYERLLPREEAAAKMVTWIPYRSRPALCSWQPSLRSLTWTK